MTIVNHYGITVDSNVPITGVLLTTDPEFLHEDMINCIDLDYEDYKDEFGEDTDNYEPTDPTILIGFRNCGGLGNETEYEPSDDVEYSAICSDQYTQIVRSKWVSRTTLCSRFPGQGDLDTEGDFLAFTLPPDVFGDHSEHLPIIKYVEKV